MRLLRGYPNNPVSVFGNADRVLRKRVDNEDGKETASAFPPKGNSQPLEPQFTSAPVKNLGHDPTPKQAYERAAEDITGIVDAQVDAAVGDQRGEGKKEPA